MINGTVFESIVKNSWTIKNEHLNITP